MRILKDVIIAIVLFSLSATMIYIMYTDGAAASRIETLK